MILKDAPSCSLGEVYGTRKMRFYNRTGATLKKGHVAMIDLLKTQAESTTIEPGASGSAWSNVGPVTQASFEAGFPIVVTDDATIADNAIGWFTMCGPYVEVDVLDDDVSTTDIDAGDPVSMVIAESAVGVQAFVTGGTGSRQVGIALEDAAASSATTARTVDTSGHLRYMIWTGGITCIGTDT